jgi:hypothetical protein
LVGATVIVLRHLVANLGCKIAFSPFAESASLGYTAATYPDVISGLMSGVVRKIDGLGALGNEVLRLCINDAANN